MNTLLDTPMSTLLDGLNALAACYASNGADWRWFDYAQRKPRFVMWHTIPFVHGKRFNPWTSSNSAPIADLNKLRSALHKRTFGDNIFVVGKELAGSMRRVLGVSA